MEEMKGLDVITKKFLSKSEEGTEKKEWTTFPLPMPYRRSEAKVGRNSPCPCGSGVKYKKCCLAPVKAGVLNEVYK